MASKHEITTLNVSLPESMREFVDDEVTRGHYTSASEYLRELIRRAQREQQVINFVLPGGVDGGPPPGVSKSEWRELRATLAGAKIDELRRSLDRAAAELDRGEGRELDIEDVVAQGRRRTAAKKRSP